MFKGFFLKLTIYIGSLVPRLPPFTRNYCVTFELVQKSPPDFLHEFKGHAIIARKGGEPGNEATILEPAVLIG